MTFCMGQMHTTSGSECDQWNAAVCCLKDAFTSCGSDFSSTVDGVLNIMKPTDVSGCAEAVCSGTSSSSSSSQTGVTSTPVAVEKILNTMIELLDPTAFDLGEYIAAVKEQTGTVPIAEILAWEVVIGYAVPDGTTDAQLKVAVAMAMNVTESLIKIATASGARRLTTLRRLSVDKDVTITANGAAQAKELKDDTKGTAALDSLKNALGGDVSVKTAPKTKANVETRIVSTKTMSEHETELLDSTVASKVGGTITVAQNMGGTSMETMETSGGFRSGLMIVTSIALAIAA